MYLTENKINIVMEKFKYLFCLVVLYLCTSCGLKGDLKSPESTFIGRGHPNYRGAEEILKPLEDEVKDEDKNETD